MSLRKSQPELNRSKKGNKNEENSKSNIDKLVEEVEEAVENPEPRQKSEISIYSSDDLVPTGSTLLNLALSDNPYGGYRLGTMVNIIGGPSSGKSLMALTMYAEITNDKRFNNYELIYDETEAAMFFDLSAFGENINKVRFDLRSRTIQDWSENLMGLFNLGKKDKRKKDLDIQPIIHVTDSFDALSTDSDLEDTRPSKGGYRTEKPIVSSVTFPKLCQAVEASRSLLFIISQTRSSLAMFGNPESRSGGKALDFYESHEIWLRKSTPIKQTVKRSGKDVVVGNSIVLDVKKNKLVGKRRSVEIDVLDQYGIDDIGSCINWLNKYGFWGIDKKVIDPCGDLDLPKAKIKELVKIIEEQNMESDFRKIIAECWYEVEEELKPNRKKRY